MLDAALQEFLLNRLKSQDNPMLTDLQQALNEWLPKAAKTAKKLGKVTHPVKFSHPDAKNLSEIRAIVERRADGFLRTGNVAVDYDTIFDTAENMPVASFFALNLADGRSLLAHLEEDSDYVKQQLSIPSMPYAELRDGLLAIYELNASVKTSEKIKQVYFPVEEGYHLLSVLTPSGLVFKLKERLKAMQQVAKECREDKANDREFDEIYQLKMIGYGGTKPQNISLLNLKHAGTAYLLSAVPPSFDKARVARPSRNYFADIVRFKAHYKQFWALHNLYVSPIDNHAVKTAIADTVVEIFHEVIEKSWAIRQLEAGWSDNSPLKQSQKIWLDAKFAESRELEDEWLADVMADFVRWLVFAYKKTLGEDRAIALGKPEFLHYLQVLSDFQEDLR